MERPKKIMTHQPRILSIIFFLALAGFMQAAEWQWSVPVPPLADPSE